MYYLAYNIKTTRYLPSTLTHFATQSAAKAAITRAFNSGKIADKSEYTVADNVEFYNNIEKTETVKNMMSGNDVEQSVNTPHCCDVSSETYWSM